jgi:hypothetical protein
VITLCNKLLEDSEDYLVSHPEDERFTFPLPSGVDDPVPWRNLPQPPFLNWQLTLLSLLNDCSANFTGIGVTKPKPAVIATSPGYGKTSNYAVCSNLNQVAKLWGTASPRVTDLTRHFFKKNGDLFKSLYKNAQEQKVLELFVISVGVGTLHISAIGSLV